MNRLDIVLAAMAPNKNQIFRPVQIQKLLFLIDREISHVIGGPFFDFKPYNYGPFDKEVYEDLSLLAQQGLVSIEPENSWSVYALTDKGYIAAEQILRTMPANVQVYFDRISKFVHEQSFKSLVLAIYRAYPEMQQNSIFRE